MATRILSAESFVEEKQKETELTLYAKVDNFEYFDRVKTYREIIQLQASLGSYQSCRCRKEMYYQNGVAISETPKYSFTVKANGKKSRNLSIKTEYNFTVDEDFYQYFLETANTRQIKKRYTFKVSDYDFKIISNGEEKDIVVPYLNFEIDIFEKLNGYRSNWVKIDIELDKAFSYIREHYDNVDDIVMSVKLSLLPMSLKQGFIEKEATLEQKKCLEDLWKYEFVDTLGKRGR
jgi:hypothetical protein